MSPRGRNTLKNLRANRFKWFYISLALSAVICTGLLIHGVHLVKVEDVRGAVAQDLAPGSDQATVHRFMDSHHILYTGYSQELRRMFGKIYGTSFVGLMKGHILVQIDFDEQGRMKSSRVVEVYDFLWE